MNQDQTTTFCGPFTREKTDEQYNPTLWTKRLPTDDLLPAHIEFTGENSDHYRAEMGAQLQQTEFGEGGLLGSMDIYRPDDLSEDAPIVVYIHGGWWQWFSKEQFCIFGQAIQSTWIRSLHARL